MSYVQTGTVRLGICDGDSATPNTPENWYILSPGCSFQRTLTKDNIDIGIPSINDFIEDIGLSSNDIITVTTQLTYDHNDEDPWITIKKLYYEAKQRLDSGTSTGEKRKRYILEVGGSTTNKTIDPSGKYFPDDNSFYCMVNEITVNIEPGGKPPELTIRLKPTNTHDSSVSV